MSSKIVMLPIQKSAAKSFAAADSEINSQVLCRYREVGIKNCVAANPEIGRDGGFVLA